MKHPIQKFLLLSVYSVVTILAVNMLVDINNSAYLFTINQDAHHKSAQQLSFNRYQVGYVCKERGWEFCESWSRYARTRLA